MIMTRRLAVKSGDDYVVQYDNTDTICRASGTGIPQNNPGLVVLKPTTYAL